MNFKIQFNLDNDAFKDNPIIEIKRILKELSEQLDYNSPVGTCSINLD